MQIVGFPMQRLIFSMYVWGFQRNSTILLQLTVLQGDIVKVIADAIVHPTSNSFYLGGEVGQALQKAGGKDFQQEVKSLHTSHGDLDTASGINIH